MKKSFIYMIAILLSLALAQPALARNNGNTNQHNLHKSNVGGVAQSMINIGNWGFWINAHGQTGHDPFTGSSGGYYPRGKATSIYMDGFMWGGWKGEIDRANPAGKLFCGGIGYRIGTIAGWIQEDGTAIDPTNERVGIYRIRADWRSLTADMVRQDAAELNNMDITEVTDQQIEEIITQYKQDWKNWPVDLGAPYYDVDGDGTYNPVLDDQGYAIAGTLYFDDGSVIVGNDYPGLAQADQVAWLVVNDLNESRTQYHTGSDPMGLELQITLWGYNQPLSLLGQIIYKRYKIINKSQDTIDSMFVAQYSDPDIGNYGDDLVGCDVQASLHFAYNGFQTDWEYASMNMVPPAVGYDFLQGPIVDGAPGDTAVFNMQKITGKKNLPMTSFGYRSAGASIGYELGVYDISLEWFNMMNGFWPTTDLQNPTPYTEGSGPNAGNPTKFPLWGDPESDPTGGISDIDGQGNNLPPGDRRMFAASGPFKMDPGDVQEIVVAIIGGHGYNYLNSVTDLKATDYMAQEIYTSLFSEVVKPPAEPKVHISAFDDAILLNWGADQDRVKDTEETTILGYAFEGYNVYQLPFAHSKITDPGVQRIATFDRINDVDHIESFEYDPLYGRYHQQLVQFGTNSGIQRSLLIEKDYLNDRPLYKGSSYHFAVTAYNYDGTQMKDRALESAGHALSATVQDPLPGVRHQGSYGQMLEVTKDSMLNDVKVEVQVLDPTVTTGHNYRIEFMQDADTNSATYGKMVWNLIDVNLGIRVLEKQLPQEDLRDGDYPIADGLMLKVVGPEAGIKAFVQVANAGGALAADQWDAAGQLYSGNNVWYSLSAPSDANRFFIGAGGGAAGTTSDKYLRLTRSIQNAGAHDFELRFKDNTDNAIYLWWYDDDTYDNVPFEFWDVGIGTYDDPSDDVRMLTGGYSGGTATGTGGFGYDYTDVVWGYPATDWIYARVPTTEWTSWDTFYSDVTSGTLNYYWWNNSAEVISRLVICDYAGNGVLPEAGTVIRFITNKVPQEGSSFTFSAPATIEDRKLAKQDVEKINVFPNPYYAYNALEQGRFYRFVTFTHLPEKATIRIFNLAGVQVRKLEKGDEGQFLRWDLRNESNLSVASGLYIVYIDMPDLNKRKTLKLMIIQGEQAIEYF